MSNWARGWSRPTRSCWMTNAALTRWRARPAWCSCTCLMSQKAKTMKHQIVSHHHTLHHHYIYVNISHKGNPYFKLISIFGDRFLASFRMAPGPSFFLVESRRVIRSRRWRTLKSNSSKRTSSASWTRHGAVAELGAQFSQMIGVQLIQESLARNVDISSWYMMISQKRLVVWSVSFMISLAPQKDSKRSIHAAPCGTSDFSGANRLRAAALSGAGADLSTSTPGCLPTRQWDRLIHSDALRTCLTYLDILVRYDLKWLIQERQWIVKDSWILKCPSLINSCGSIRPSNEPSAQLETPSLGVFVKKMGKRYAHDQKKLPLPSSIWLWVKITYPIIGWLALKIDSNLWYPRSEFLTHTHVKSGYNVWKIGFCSKPQVQCLAADESDRYHGTVRGTAVVHPVYRYTHGLMNVWWQSQVLDIFETSLGWSPNADAMHPDFVWPRCWVKVLIRSTGSDLRMERMPAELGQQVIFTNEARLPTGHRPQHVWVTERQNFNRKYWRVDVGCLNLCEGIHNR